MWGGGSQGQNTLCAASTSSSSWCGNVKCLNNSPSFYTTGIITILTRAQEPPRTFIGIITGEPFPGSTKYQRFKQFVRVWGGTGARQRAQLIPTEVKTPQTHQGRGWSCQNTSNPSGREEQASPGPGGPVGAHQRRHPFNNPIFYSQARVPPRGLSPRIRSCLNFNWRVRVHPYPTSSCRRCCHGTSQPLPCYPRLDGMRQRGMERAELYLRRVLKQPAKPWLSWLITCFIISGRKSRRPFPNFAGWRTPGLRMLPVTLRPCRNSPSLAQQLLCVFPSPILCLCTAPGAFFPAGSNSRAFLSSSDNQKENAAVKNQHKTRRISSLQQPAYYLIKKKLY